ncbi:McrB family protein [Fictibacillus sp. 26RED30]|uniref:McrB family protein n=1 Tax=Fictibacillus sp. 26RED30 TaxID=2745877 RepID=UPI0018CE1DC5|nr:AAA family ATPase [Fictibacillus sp. 26RED30]MBH0160449.1 AAA family ATPase [Fictibacillus sp. 26RED30]
MMSLNQELDQSFRSDRYRLGKEKTRYYVLTANLRNEPYKVYVIDRESIVRETEANSLNDAKKKAMELLQAYNDEYRLSDVTMCHFKENRGWEKDRDQYPEIYENKYRNSNKRGSGEVMNETVTGIFNLSAYQTIFNEADTTNRCRTVLDTIHPEIKAFFERFCRDNNLLTENRVIKDYSVTLTTTYHDSKNPKLSEQKKNTKIGKKYYIALNEKIGEQEVNLLTLELNGVDQKLYISVDSTFLPMWYLMRVDRLMPAIQHLSEDVYIYFQSDWFKKEQVSRTDFKPVFTTFRKQRKRPYYHFGTELSLHGQISQKELEIRLLNVWGNTGFIKEKLLEEKEWDKQGNELLDLFINEGYSEDTIQLLEHSYSLIFGEVDNFKSKARRQAFSIHDQDQLITKGFIIFYEIDETISPNQVICVAIEGHDHIYSNVRDLVLKDEAEWWIKKVFTTRHSDNTELSKKAMVLLNKHGFETEGNSYYVGTYNNETKSFNKEIRAIKKELVTASLLFAYVSERLELPDTNPDRLDPNEDESEEIIKVKFVSNFSFRDIHETIANSQFTFSIDIIRDFHLNLTALDDKHFVILNGISGTGKTQLCRLYANAVYGLDYESENPYLTIIPVRPDWMDATALFGYYSSFEKKYVMTEFLQVLISAQKERDKPHFIVLDEMNLARVEYYLSDYLSAVESRKEILLHNREDVTDISQKINIPPNVYVLGTINVDETTHSLSDKVLDRAFVMTLSDVDFDHYWSTLDQSVKLMVSNEYDILCDIHNDLKSFDLHFGYRTMNEMIQKLVRNKELDEEFSLGSMPALDRVISEKMLPKLRGDERMAELLATLKTKFQGHFGEKSQSYGHILRMEKELERYGATQFWR